MSKRSRVTLFVALAVGLAVSPALAQLAPLPRMFAATSAQSSASAQADSIVQGINGAGGSVGKQLAAARAAKDVVKSLCLNDKLSQINAAAGAAKQKKTAIGSDADPTSDVQVLQTLAARVQQLVTEANQCIGAEGSVSEGATVTQTIDQGQPTDSPPAWFPVILPGDLPSATGIGVAPPNSFPTAGVAPPECVSPDK